MNSSIDESYFAGHPRSGWFVLAFLVVLAAFVWIKATPAYIRYFLMPPDARRTVTHEVTGDGTVPGRKAGEMAMVFFNVEYGDGILIQGPGNTTSLIDGGEGKYPESPEAYALDYAFRLYLPFLRKIGKTDLENMISTVPASHHMGVQPDLLAVNEINVRNIYWTGYQARFGAHRRFRVHAKREGNFQVLQEGDPLDFGRGIKARVLYGNNNVKVKPRASRVILVKYGSKTFLLMSDLPRQDEKKLVLEWGKSLDSDLIKLGSHGADDSNTEELFKYVSPEHAVISVSEKNPLGAPQEKVLQALKNQGVDNVYQTSEDGHIAVYTDGNSLRVNTRSFPFL